MNVTLEHLKRIAPRRTGQKLARQTEILDGVERAMPGVAEEFEITTPLRMAHFLSQLAHESDGFTTLEEYASGKNYEGRDDLGNTEPGDGRRFKGRGLIQLTGRANYAETGERLGLELIQDPELAGEDVGVALRIAGDYWKSRDLNTYADADDLRGVTRRINGGFNGLHDRSAYLSTAKSVLGVTPSADLLKLGSQGPDVRLLQERLNAALYHVGATDGIFGGRTDDSVRSFQRDKDLSIDGLVRVGGATWSALAAALAEGERRPVFEARKEAGVINLAKDGSRIAGASVQGAGATIASTVTAGGMILAEASEQFTELAGPLIDLTTPFGGPGKLALGLLALAAVYSAYQHIRAGRARADDHRKGKTA